MELSLWQQIDGSILNAIGVIVGGIAGLVFRNALPTNVTQTIQYAIGLITVFLAVRIAWQLGDIEVRTIPGIVVALIGLTLGGAIGELFHLDERLSAIAQQIQTKTGQQGNG
ncbi:MAG: DUF554 domain-containing protein, partial [Chloroflexi bacterium]|nr:DUF554 domain-containing protein [Chloroflexota bacterium]